MKQKRFQPPRSSLLRWHLIGFTLLVLLATYSVVAEITYPGNADIPFAILRPLIMERLSLILLVGATVVVHFIVQQSYAYLRFRAYQDVQRSMMRLPDADDRPWLEIQDGDAEVPDDSFRTEKRKRRY